MIHLKIKFKSFLKLLKNFLYFLLKTILIFISLLNNEKYSLVGRSIDLSVEGISLIWVHDLPLNEKFEISTFRVKNVSNRLRSAEM